MSDFEAALRKYEAGPIIPIEEQIKEVKLELMFRRSTYAKMVEQRRMRQDVADRRTEAMLAVLATLEALLACWNTSVDDARKQQELPL